MLNWVEERRAGHAENLFSPAAMLVEMLFGAVAGKLVERATDDFYQYLKRNLFGAPVAVPLTTPED